MARWQRERRQQTVIVTLFGAVLFFTLGLVAWAASDRYYTANLKPSLTVDGHSYAMRDYARERGYELTQFYVDYGVPPGYENDQQILQQKATYDAASLDAMVEHYVLDQQAKADGVVITQQQIDDRYTTDYSEFHSRHVLIAPKPLGDTDADKTAADNVALAKARAIAAQLQQDPNNQDLWNALAKDNSDDPGSAASGGDLGFVGKGQFVKEYEDAAHGLSIGQVSDPVKSQYGYHVIQLIELKGPDKSQFVTRAASYGYTVADVKQHVRWDILKEMYTDKAKKESVQSPTPQVHLAWIAVAAPKVQNGDFQSFTDQLKKVGDIQKAIDAGTDFKDIVSQYTEDSSTKDTGGDLGWFAHGMITRLDIEDDVFKLEVGKVSVQKSDASQTVWYKALEKDPARALDDDQKKKISDNAYSYWYQNQKRAHSIQKLVPGHELDT